VSATITPSVSVDAGRVFFEESRQLLLADEGDGERPRHNTRGEIGLIVNWIFWLQPTAMLTKVLQTFRGFPGELNLEEMTTGAQIQALQNKFTLA